MQNQTQGLERAKKDAKRLLGMAKENSGNINIPNLSSAQKIIAKIRGFDSWYDFEKFTARHLLLSGQETKPDVMDLPETFVPNRMGRETTFQLMDLTPGNMGLSVIHTLPGYGKNIILSSSIAMAGRKLKRLATISAIDSLETACQVFSNWGECTKITLRKNSGVVINPLDISLGKRIPNAAELADMCSFVLSLMDKPLEDSWVVIHDAIKKTFIKFSDIWEESEAFRYVVGRRPDIDELFKPEERPDTWWEVVDHLSAIPNQFTALQIRRAQDMATPTLQDVMYMMEESPLVGFDDLSRNVFDALSSAMIKSLDFFRQTEFFQSDNENIRSLLIQVDTDHHRDTPLFILAMMCARRFIRAYDEKAMPAALVVDEFHRFDDEHGVAFNMLLKQASPERACLIGTQYIRPEHRVLLLSNASRIMEAGVTSENALLKTYSHRGVRRDGAEFVIGTLRSDGTRDEKTIRLMFSAFDLWLFDTSSPEDKKLLQMVCKQHPREVAIQKLAERFPGGTCRYEDALYPYRDDKFAYGKAFGEFAEKIRLELCSGK